jgi:endonuclease/exonuclease/phosphatase family metal-dependent hydrolase
MPEKKNTMTLIAFRHAGGLLLLSLLLQSCATNQLRTFPAVQSYQHRDLQLPTYDETTAPAIRVMTLNIAHGRGDSFHQLLQDSDTTLANLTTIASLFRATAPDVVALQEADGPSFWSGNFDHVEYLANRAAFRRSVHGAHVDGIGLSYGTALLANVDLTDAHAVTFDPSLSAVPKGFVISTIRWPGEPCVDIDVVSIHLDFARQSVRRKQATELIETVRRRNRPVIIMGDLNSEWQGQDSTVQYLSRELGLSAYGPERDDLNTFPAFGERLDWILVSPDLKFRSYQVLPDIVSDHHGVVAEVVLDSKTRLSANPGYCGAIAKASP